MWTVPNTPSPNCLVRITGSDSDGGPSDVSNGEFTITPSTASTITVGTPNGRESLSSGSSFEITWSSTGTITSVKIEYSTDGGSSWKSIIASTGNDGSYMWTVPNEPSDSCLVKISSGDSDMGPSDVSNGVFSIVSSGR
jgi:hypothetical protein